MTSLSDDPRDDLMRAALSADADADGGPNGAPRRRSARVALLLFVATGLAMVLNLVIHFLSDHTTQHLLLEVVVMVVSAAGVAFFWRELHRERARAHRMDRALAAAHSESRRWRAEAERWRAEAREALDGLGSAIEVQFDRWSLTAAEAEVALLLLKGLSHKEIAAVRGVSERTARQQSLAVYRKAEVAGRAELSAFFLEDLLVPR